MKIKQLINNLVINSFLSIEELELFVYYNGFTEEGYFTQLLCSNFEINLYNKAVKIKPIYLDNYSGKSNVLDVNEIELNLRLCGSLYPEFVYESLHEFYSNYQTDPLRIYQLFKEKIKEIFCSSLPKDISVTVQIRETIGLFDQAAKHKEVKVEVELVYYKKVRKFF